MTRKPDGGFSYLNTDLDVTSPVDPTDLANVLEASGISPLHVTKSEGGRWHAVFETDEQFDEPEPNIAVMLSAIESLDDSLRRVWRSCPRREFNIGYDCGSEPWAFNQGLSSDLLRRLGEAGASLRITLYPMKHV